MADNTVTLILDGNVSLEAFAKGVSTFSELVSALSENVAKSPVRWVISDLSISSAMATARADGSQMDVGNIVSAYANVGDSLAYDRPIAYGPKVEKVARKLFDIKVERVRLETSAREALIPLRKPEPVPPQEPLRALELVRGRKPALGGIRGRIQTLTSRGGLRFTLFDLHQDKAVSCYFEEGKQDIVRDLWGRLAIVEGMITRDPTSGRPLAIRDVNQIIPLPEPNGRRNYEGARGAAPSLSRMSAEEAIRKVRDAQ